MLNLIESIIGQSQRVAFCHFCLERALISINFSIGNREGCRIAHKDNAVGLDIHEDAFSHVFAFVEVTNGFNVESTVAADVVGVPSNETMAGILCVKIYGLVVVALSFEVARLDDNLAIAHCLNIEKSRCEAERQVRTTSCTANVESTLMLDDVSRVALSNEAEGNLIHLLNGFVVNKAKSLTDGHFLKTFKAYERICLRLAFTFGFNVGWSNEVLKEVAKRCVDSASLAPLMCVVVCFAVELECVPLAFLNRIGKSEDVACPTHNGFRVSIKLFLRVVAAFEVSCCFLNQACQDADLVVWSPEAWVLANCNHAEYVLVCSNCSSKSTWVIQHSLECIEGSLQCVVV